MTMMTDDHDDEIVERLTALRQKISDTVWTLATDAAQQFAPDALDALVLAKARLEAIDFALQKHGPVSRSSTGRMNT